MSQRGERLRRAARTPVASARSLAGRLRRTPGPYRRYRQLQAENERLRDTYETWVPPGHFYSPFPDLADYERRAAGLLDPGSEVPGVDLREDEQLALLAELAPLMAEAPFPEHEGEGGGRWRYWYDNHAYGYGDGVVLHAMLRRLRPSRVVEVGSGYSSALLLDTVEGWLPGTEVTFVEPFPALLESLLRPDDVDRVTIHRQPVQDVAPDVFEALGQPQAQQAQVVVLHEHGRALRRGLGHDVGERGVDLPVGLPRLPQLAAERRRPGQVVEAVVHEPQNLVADDVVGQPVHLGVDGQQPDPEVLGVDHARGGGLPVAVGHRRRHPQCLGSGHEGSDPRHEAAGPAPRHQPPVLVPPERQRATVRHDDHGATHWRSLRHAPDEPPVLRAGHDTVPTVRSLRSLTSGRG